MKKSAHIYILFLIFLFSAASKAQNQATDSTRSVAPSPGPNSGIRTIKQDKKGNIWFATSTGVFRYDGRSFANLTSQLTSAGFSTVLEDSKGNLWFGSLGAGVFYYDGTSFRNFTVNDGLASNGVITIYEDKAGNIWFGTDGAGASRYDGNSFRSYSMKAGLFTFATIFQENTLSSMPNIIMRERPNYTVVTAILEDRTGKFWFCTKEDIFIYDGRTFTVFTNEDGKPFSNTRSIIEDKKGNIWLGGNDGLWRYDGHTFTSLTANAVGDVYEDKKGNIWTTLKRTGDRTWVLSRYDEKSLSGKKPAVTEIDPKTGRQIYGILEANDGKIWFGSGGVNIYDGNRVIQLTKPGKTEMDRQDRGDGC